MQENEPRPKEKPNKEDIQANPYEFYLLLQRLKAGGMSFDTFLKQATAWASIRSSRK